MNKWLYVCCLLLCFCCMGCFEDESSSEIRNLNPIRIENISLNGSYALYQGDTLKIKPLVFCEGVPDAELDFKWELSGGIIVPTILDSTMYMSAAISAPPAAQSYMLKFTVTDKTTGIARIEKFNVSVQSPYEAGLLVADSKDGQNSDLSLIQSREFNVNIPQDNDVKKIFRNLWRQSNGAPFDGKILGCITNEASATGRILTVLTTEHIYRADFYDYVNIPEEMDGGAFLVVPPYIGHGYESGCFGEEEGGRSAELISVNGLLAGRVLYDTRKYGYTLYPPGIIDYDVTMMYNVKWCPVYCYDALGKRMLFSQGLSLWTADEQIGGPFDVNDLSDYDPILLDKIQSGIVLLAKEKSTGAFVGLVMNELRKNGNNFAKSKFDFSAAPNVEQAKFFDVNRMEDVVYYADGSRLYAAPVANPGSGQVQWTVPLGSDEKITGIKVYDFETGGKCMYQDVDGSGRKMDKFLNSSCHMMMIFTYSEVNQEGKITCVPIKTLGRGGLEKERAYHVTFQGFNKILGVYCQVGRGVL